MFHRGWNGVPQWVLQQGAWWACVLGAEPWGYLVMILFVIVHLGFNRSQLGTEGLLVLVALGVGFCVDAVLIHSSFVHYEGLHRVLDVPLWMLALWAGFGATLRHSQRLLVASPIRGFLIGALAGPLAYAGGEGLGRLEISGVGGFFLIGLNWAIALGILAWCVRRSDASETIPLDEPREA